MRFSGFQIGTLMGLHGSGHVFSLTVFAKELCLSGRPEPAVLTHVLYP